MFDPILVPTWLHFGTQNPPKSTQKSIPRGIQKMIDFWIDFLPKLAPFWDPSWDPRAAQDGPKTPPKTFPRRHQDSPRATRASKTEIWSIFGPKVRWGMPPWPKCLEFVVIYMCYCFLRSLARQLPYDSLWLLLDYLCTSLYGSISFTGFPIICDCS